MQGGGRVLEGIFPCFIVTVAPVQKERRKERKKERKGGWG